MIRVAHPTNLHDALLVSSIFLLIFALLPPYEVRVQELFEAVSIDFLSVGGVWEGWGRWCPAYLRKIRGQARRQGTEEAH
ncbi:uncharacterized protein EI97DRAFT_192620 [Westerdykella ornata]|uniref:Uncharacterized protein n=1 Tax=Westerdykella ornata TaxID=318751 RepID=A0A6A6J8W7_WESOR|nr:uncharacterized protein EI97DRAFT_192620 [Westerdykella ornata]KAF2273010.1 hypothetical protein EI97DRAFT_192620 [Westerdykella ornata]